MNFWLSPVPHRWEHTAPVSPVLPYGSFPSLQEDDNGSSRSDEREAADQARSESAKPTAASADGLMLPSLRRFALDAERLVSAARDVVASASRLRAASEHEAAEMENFVEYVKRMLGNDNEFFQLLSDLPPHEDAAYIPGDDEIVAYWEHKALAVLAAPPIDLVWDEDAFPAYSAYNGDKRKVWQVPRQGWIIQTYG